MPQAPKKSKVITPCQTSTILDRMEPIITATPLPLQGLESLDFEDSYIFSFFRVMPAADSFSKSDFYVMIVKSEKLTSSLIVLNNEF